MGSTRDTSASSHEEWWLRPIDRRTLLKGSGRTAAGLWLVGGLSGLATACAGGDDTGGGSGGGGGGGGQLPATVKVGVITPMSGLAQFLGELTQRGVDAGTQHINDEALLPGTTVEYEIVSAPVEDGAEGAVNAYNQLVADPDVIGIIWGCTTGLRETLAQIQRDQMPVMAATYDLDGFGDLDPAATPTVFQFIPPNAWLTDVMCEYAATDRAYRTAALIFDSSLYLTQDAEFTARAEAAGLELVGIEEFNIGTFDFGAQLQRLKDAAPECLHVWGLPDNVAAISRGLADLDARYIDTPTAKSGEGWHPQIIGHPSGFTPKWAELAGDAADPYCVMSWYLGGSLQTPEITGINQWVLDSAGRPPEGGEELSANALWALLEAARQAGSTDRAAIVEKLPGLQTEFATLPFVLDPETHLALTHDDIITTTYERTSGPADTDPPYVLGTEVRNPGPAAPDLGESPLSPTILVRPNLEANQRAQPEYMAYVLANGVGTQCTKTPPDARGEDAEMTDACKIH